jgi:hypothetical protein
MLNYYPIERERRIHGPRLAPDVDWAKLAEPGNLRDNLTLCVGSGAGW